MTGPSETHSRSRLALLSVSIDLGAGRRGVDMGPSAIRIAGLADEMETMGYGLLEMGVVHARGPETTTEGESRARYLDEITDVCQRARDLLLDGLGEERMPVILGGDHSLSMGTVAAVSRHYRERQDQPVGLIWVDAHTDMNTPETTPSGNVHGMALAVLLGRGPRELTGLAGGSPAVSAEHVSILGVREVDAEERRTVLDSGVRVFTMSEIDERGMAECMDEAIDRATRGTAGFHLSFDLDSIDPMVAPGVGTPVAGGLTYREAHLLCEKVARSRRLVGLEVVEVNPVLDLGNRTAGLAVGLVTSILGKTIL